MCFKALTRQKKQTIPPSPLKKSKTKQNKKPHDFIPICITFTGYYFFRTLFKHDFKTVLYIYTNWGFYHIRHPLRSGTNQIHGALEDFDMAVTQPGPLIPWPYHVWGCHFEGKVGPSMPLTAPPPQVPPLPGID